MKVLHIIPSVSPVRGGPSQALLELVAALQAQGQASEIVCTNDDGQGVLDVPLAQLTEYAGVPVRFFPRFSPPVRSLREFAFSAALTRWLRTHTSDYGLLHVHALFSHSSSTAMRIARRKQVPYINRPSGLLCRWSLQQSRARKHLFLTLSDRASLDGAAALEFTAEQERDETADLSLNAPSFIMPYGLHLPEPMPSARDELRQQLGVAQNEFVILFMSRLHPKKGLHCLIEALETIADRRFSLVVAGSGPADYTAQVSEQAHRGSLNGRVHFVGFAQRRAKQIFLQGADLFALTSHSESFAIAAMEAMAAGTPVLITPGIPLASLVRKFDVGWVTELDRGAIASAAVRALDSISDDELSKARKMRCRKLAVNFEWSRIAARMKTVYEAVLDQQPLPSFQLADATV